jgi:chemotaxis receptor (MCP) glutamine deamidase CheD
MVLLSAMCVFFPQKLVVGMPYLANSKLARYSDIAVRLMLGISLILSSNAAKFPLVFSIVGYLSLVAVIAIVALGNRKIESIVKYIGDKLPILVVRLVCIFSALGFSFLIYGI